MSARVLVVTTVHRADDTRIRERLVRSLAADFEVVYATRVPGPTDQTGLSWIALPGGRARRWFEALALAARQDFAVTILHDPETIPIGILVRALKRRPVVFDVHEDIPATALTRHWVPARLRRPLAVFSRLVLRLAESALTITLAEPGYSRLFRRDHPVFPNYPDTSSYPDPIREPETEVVHVGDVTVVRGLDVAVEACAMAGLPLRLIGPVAEETRETLSRLASDRGGEVRFDGPLPNPEAMRVAAQAAVAIVPWKDLPNYRESLPTKLFEYLALGVPVVASDLPGIRSVSAGLDGVVLVLPGDPQALAAGIRKAADPGMRDAARARVAEVRDRFKWPEDRLRAFYRSLAGTGTQVPS